MKFLYGAANLAEAHMLQDLLAQQDIAVSIQGEYLQAGIGDLPAAGLVRMFVAEENHDAARAFITEWMNAHPLETPSATAVPRGDGFWSHLLALGVGLLIGVGSAALYYRLPVSTSVLDHDLDGQADEFFRFSSAGIMIFASADRNRDSKIDAITGFDAYGEPESSREDDDFNGSFEVVTAYKGGLVSLIETDLDGDGVADRRTTLQHGLCHVSVELDVRSHLPWRLDKCVNGTVVSSEIDKDRDGRFDTHREYDQTGEIVRETPVPSGP